MRVTNPEATDRVFSKEMLTWKQLQYIKKNISETHFIAWLKENYDSLLCYHGARPIDINSYYINGFIPPNFEKTVIRFEQLLHDIGYQHPYDIQHVLDTYRGQTDRFIYFILDREDLMYSAPHYLIYGSELLLSLAQHVDPSIKDYLKKYGIPTIFHCRIPLNQIDDVKLKGFHKRILSCSGRLNVRLSEIFSNYSIFLHPPVHPDYIVTHEHPTEPLIDYHSNGSYYHNTTAYCDQCKPDLR